jgi:hypothetical protein
MVEILNVEITSIQPSQLYISEKKLHEIQNSLDPDNPVLEDPVPIKNLNGKIIFVDGHTRAVALHLLGKKIMPVYWENEELDWNMYEICVQWCMEEGIHSIVDLINRVVSHEDYKVLWYQRCDDLHHSLKQ